jgi:hypothetical protein
MPKYTRQEVIDGRKCGLKYFDRAVAQAGIDQLLEAAIEIQLRSPHTWNPGWDNFSWALGNAVINVLDPPGDIAQTWNIDEALTPEQMETVASRCGFTEPYVVTWGRRERPVVHREGYVKTPKKRAPRVSLESILAEAEAKPKVEAPSSPTKTSAWQRLSEDDLF